MATIPSKTPVPSELPRDLKFNTGKIDEFTNSFALQYLDRFGDQRLTLEGLRRLAREAIVAFGWVPVGTFQAGATLTLPNQILRDDDGDYYRWDGEFPKVVDPGSTPATAGGTGTTRWLNVGDSTLRWMLASEEGAAFIHKRGGGTVQDAIDDMVSRAALQRNLVFATADAGIANDGVTDVSADVLPFLNENKGKFIVFDSGVYLFAGITLGGTGWEGTTIVFKGKHLLSVNANSENNVGFAWAGINISAEVRGLTLYYRGDAQQQNQPQYEWMHLVTLCGAQNIAIPDFVCENLRGDGLYISKADPTDASADDPKNIVIGNISCEHESSIGRNLVSVIAVDGLLINNLRSINVGGLIGGALQPGGFDAEPNGENFVVQNVTIVNAYVFNGGTGGISFYGSATAKNIRNCRVVNGVLRGRGLLLLRGVKTSSFSIKVLASTSYTASSFGNCERVDADINVEGAVCAAYLGADYDIHDCNLKFMVGAISGSGVIATSMTNCNVDIDVAGFTSSASPAFGLYLRGLTHPDPAQRGNIYNVKCRRATGATGAVQYLASEPVTWAGTNKLSGDVSGFSSFVEVLRSAGLYLTKANLTGITESSYVPESGAWKAGDFVKNLQPSSAALVYGWTRITNGTGSVLGQDWGAVKFQI